MNKFININISWSMSTLIQITVSLLLNSFSGRVQSEWVQEISNLFEVWSKTIDLIDYVFHTFNADLSKSLVDNLIRRQWNSLSIELSKSSLINQSLDGFSAWESIGNIWLYASKHVHCSLVVFNEDGMSDLEESK